MVIVEIGSIFMILYYLSLAAGLANVCLLFGLLNSYWKTYKEIKSQFTIGLLYFASFLLVQNILVTIVLMIPLIIKVIPFTMPNSNLGPTILLSIINVIQLIALSILYKITKD
jgi:hypothetical protein